MILRWNISYVRSKPVGHGDEAKGSEGSVQGLRTSHREKSAGEVLDGVLCSHQRKEGQPVLGIEMSQDNTMRVDTERDGHDAEYEKRNKSAL